METSMQLARVRGNVVASVKDAGLASLKLLLLEAVDATDPDAASSIKGASANVYVAIDLIGAGVGEVVLVVHGSAARLAADSQHVPTDAAVVAIVDVVHLDGRSTFIKR
jgi:microcompartment protein CcmK/EutM